MFKNQSDRELLAKELRDKGFVRDVEMEFLRVGGEAMWVLVSMHRMKLEGETLTIGWFSDVTARKQTGEKLREARDELELRVEERTHDLSREVEGHKKTERALRTSEERLRDLAEAGSDWFWEMDRELKFSRVSGRLADTIGVGPDFLIGKSRSDLAVSAGDDEKWKAHADDLENRRPFRDFRYEITRPDGAIQYVETSGKPIFDEKEEFVGYRGTGSSVTAQVEAEKRAAKAQEQLIDAIESLADAFILFDADDRFVLCNSKYQEYYPVAARLLKPGIKFRDLIEQSIEMGELGDTGRSNEEIVKDRLERFRNATEPFFQQLKNGRWLRVGEHRTSDGGTVSIRTDVSDLRRAEEEARAAKEEAENAQDRLVTAIESLSEGFQLFDSEDRFVLCNAKYKDFYPSIADLCVPGTPFEEILRVFAASGESEEALANPEKWIAERMEKHNNPGQPFQQLLSSGRWLQISEHKTKDGGIVSLRTDITDLIEAEKRADRAQAQLIDAIESLSDSFILFDAEDRYIIGNDKVAEMYAGVADLLRPGVTFEEMLRRFVARGGIKDAREDTEGWIEERLEKHRNPGDPLVYQLDTGRWLRISEHKTADGGIVSIRSDITPLMEAERRASEAQEQLSDAIESISEAFLLFDAEDRFVLCNSKFEEYYKITAPLLRPGITFREMVRTAVERGELLGIEDPLDEWLEARMDEHRNPAGPHTHHLSSGRWMRVSDGRTLSGGFVSVRTDITDLRRAEEDLRAANQELEAFAYSVSHDLRAPLRTMDGFCQALLEDYSDSLDGEGQDYLRRVRSGSQRMAQLIDELLELSRVTRADFERRWINLSEIAKGVADALSEADPERQVEFDIQPDAFAFGDARLIRALFENLIGNAWKFTGKHARARIEFGVSLEGGRKSYFVRDDGAGFDMTYADKLFQPFQRLHSFEEFEGTGIGLAIVARVIARHGGLAWARSRVEEGTMVYFTL